MNMQHPGTKQEHLVNAKVMATILDVSEKTVRRLTARRVIPSIKVATCRRFDPEAVLAALQDGTDAQGL